ncbi:MAG: tetratricopeptide repeat protein [Pseudoxanthomonas sp.]
MIQNLLPHLLRPQALWLLLGMPVLVWLWWRRRRRADVWRGLVDAHLLPHLLVGGGRATRWGVVVLLLGYGLAVFALAGPSWRKAPQPTWQTRAPLVVALDLSDRVLATDLPPSRLLQARAKLATLLRERQGGQVALLVYGGDAFTVAPLTPDSANVALFLDALSPAIVPVSGQRADLAIERGVELLQQAGFPHGQILLMSDQADSAAQSAASRARDLGFEVSALGLGTSAGATYRDATGRFDRAALDATSLEGLASRGGGRYATLTRDAADLRALGVLDPGQADAASVDQDGTRDWEDHGYWLLPGVMLLALLAFRRGAGAVAVLALCCVLPMQPAQAAVDWWQRADQQRQEQLSNGAKVYRGGDYAAAEQVFKSQSGADAQYNLGNALAKQGRFDEAIAAYDRALTLSPKMDDAIANRAAVDAARKRQQSGDPGGNGQGNNPHDPSRQGQPKPGDQQPGPQGGGQQDPQAQAPPQPQQGQAEQGQREQDKTQTPPAAADPEAQRAADEAQKQQMQRAMAGQGKDAQDQPAQAGRQQAMAAETPEQREQRQAVDAWLRRVPDDPGGLLRAKFEREYQRRQQGGR